MPLKKLSKKAIGHFNIMNMQISNFIDGVRLGMDIPQDWRFDQAQMAFVAPEPEAKPVVPFSEETPEATAASKQKQDMPDLGVAAPAKPNE